MQIYLDYSATTPPRSEVISLMQQVMAEQWGNPSSLHTWGNRSATLLERARMQVARLVNAPAEAIVFTSGGTESDNLAIFGVARQYYHPQHVIISSVEHSAISEPAKQLEREGWQVTWLPVNSAGRIDPADLQAAIQPNTVLISLIWGQSEIGTLQPIGELGAIARAHNVLFHTDAVQVAGRLAIDVQTLPVDLLSLSSHKLYGPQGAGALYVRPGVELVPLLGGGGQEGKLRSGTQAMPAIAGFGLAAELICSEMATETTRLTQLRDRLFDLLADSTLVPTGDLADRLPHHISFCLPEADGEQVSGKTLVRQMNLAGIGISAGAACSSGKITPSPILTALGWSDRVAKTGIRLTLGRHTTEADIDWTAMVLQQVLDRLTGTIERSVSMAYPPLKPLLR
ncbi:cysteine desulfurase family protein [Alkalinema sp. FACHB-956]|uniref:cysteine desulfurase family protein n=1 Tax=Alkalinema sp. FACHB-956 TaxID=2692768 RepID=UPI0016854130|nr:cysteine desulfurase family protein [Alkalinema sp. FACHB-956]MBD2328643.1 cysteine desulfurase [Alkalinema sp. FACHB-956]